MSERRAGGESGVKSVQAVRGPKVWDIVASRPDTDRLLLAALARSFTFKTRELFPLFLLNGLLSDFNYAGLVRGGGEMFSCQMYLPMPPALSTLADFFNPLAHHIEQMIVNNAAPYPVERSLLCSGMTLTALDSLYRGQIVRPTPELAVAYAAPAGSHFWRS